MENKFKKGDRFIYDGPFTENLGVMICEITCNSGILSTNGKLHHPALCELVTLESIQKTILENMISELWKIREGWENELSTNQVQWIDDAIIEVEVGFLKTKLDASTRAEELVEQGFTMTYKEAIESLTSRIVNTLEYIKD